MPTKFTRLGANDPEFNLRRDAAFIVRKPDSKDTVFATVVESHGSYSPVSELAVNSNSNIAELNVAFDDPNYTAVSVEDVSGRATMLIVAADASTSKRHQVEIAGRVHRWSGPYRYADIE